MKDVQIVLDGMASIYQNLNTVKAHCVRSTKKIFLPGNMSQQNKCVAEVKIPLPAFPTSEVLALVEKLFWNEHIYEVNLEFNASSDSDKYVMSVKSPNHLIHLVADKLNEVILNSR